MTKANNTTKRLDGGPLDRTQWAWGQHQQHGFNGSGFMVLFALVGHAHKKTGRCRPGIALLAEETKLSQRQVRRALEDLESAGAVKIVESGKLNHRASVYLVTGQEDDWGFPDGAFIPGMARPDEIDEWEQVEAAKQHRTLPATKPAANKHRTLPATKPAVSEDEHRTFSTEHRTFSTGESAGFVSVNVLPTPRNPLQPPAKAGVVKGNTTNQPTKPPTAIAGGLVDSGSVGDGDRIEAEAEQVHIDYLALKVEAEKAEADAIPPCCGCGRAHWTPDINKERHAVKTGSPLSNRICYGCPGPTGAVAVGNEGAEYAQ